VGDLEIEFRASDFRYQVSGISFQVSGFGYRVSGIGGRNQVMREAAEERGARFGIRVSNIRFRV